MKTEYDSQADALAVQFQPGGRDVRTQEVAPGIYLDFDSRGRLTAIEVLSASKHFPRQTLKQIGITTGQLTLAEAAKESGLSHVTLRRQIHQGRIVAEKRGRDWMIDEQSLVNYLESRAPSGRLPMVSKARKARGQQKARKTA